MTAIALNLLRVLGAGVGCVVALAMTASAHGMEVLLVRSSDAAPYLEADAAIRKELSAKGHSFRQQTLKEANDAGPAKLNGVPAAIAIGTPAASWLSRQMPPGGVLSYCMVSNPDAAGLLQGRQATGVVTDVPLPEQVRIIGEFLPQVRTIGTLCRTDTPDGKKTLETLKQAMPAGWRVEAVAVNEHPSVAAAIDTLTRRKVDLIWTTADQSLYDAAAVRALLLSAIRTKTPVWGFSPAFVRAGAMIGAGVAPEAQGRQAADLVSRLLRDPAAQKERAAAPRELQIALNLIVAQQIGIDVPEPVARRASVVFRPEK